MEPNIADREYRKRMLTGAGTEVVIPGPRPPGKEEAAPKIHEEWSLVYLGTVGALAGFLGSVTSLVANVLGAWALGIERLMLLRVYATIFEGSDALQLENTSFVAVVLLIHIIVGAMFGVVFVTLTSHLPQSRQLAHYAAAGLGFGLLLWIGNFYLVLSWLQPLISGDAYIVENIPWWVAALTHSCYGLTLAAVAFPFLSDVEAHTEKLARLAQHR